MDGVLVIDKPKGPTSFEVVQSVRKKLGVAKAGHTGTLDPLATGVLPICLGQATKVAGFLSSGSKRYQATLRLGIETDTYDAGGREIRRSPVPRLGEAQVESALAAFRGTFFQVPPMYSAVKVAGRRLYQLARQGREVPRSEREVTVYELTLEGLTADELKLSLKCSKGFFVRALAHDLGQALGCGAHLLALRRTGSGPFTLEQALPASLDMRWEQIHKSLIPISQALGELPLVELSAEQATQIACGRQIEVSSPSKGRVRVVGPNARLLAIAEVGSDRRLRTLRFLGQGPELTG